VTNVVVDVLLGLAVAAELVCCLGVVVMRTTADRLHYAGAGATLGPLLVLVALLLREGFAAAGLQALAAVGLLFVSGPLVVHALARATRRIDVGTLEPLPEEEAA
jgi:multicomponent Na+:H+ antiporter subunit G